MAKQTINTIKLGIFIIAGLLLLILGLYLIGRDSNLFSRNYVLKARFEHVQGLTPGNNIRYAGIQVGTVKKVAIISDSSIEVTMLIEEDMKQFIRVNDVVSISTDGLMGNKLLQITPAKDGSAFAVSGDMLRTKKTISTDEMLELLNRTNQNVAVISEDLKNTVQRINNSKVLWEVLDDEALPKNILATVHNIRSATVKADQMVNDLQTIIADVKQGKGSLGKIITDTAIAYNLNEAIEKIKQVGIHADSLAADLQTFTRSVNNDVTNGKGTVHSLLKDSILVQKLNNSLQHIEKGTEDFQQNMEALKHSFLLRGYFRRLEKQKKELRKRNDE
jgi:phospholipid/cholesterol/gamma-HCH transport system substrate-binding protein